MQNCKMFMIDLRTFVVKFLSQFTHIFRQYLFCQKAVFANLFALWMYEPDGVLLVSFERFYKVVCFVWSCFKVLWSFVDDFNRRHLGQDCKNNFSSLGKSFYGIASFSMVNHKCCMYFKIKYRFQTSFSLQIQLARSTELTWVGKIDW